MATEIQFDSPGKTYATKEAMARKIDAAEFLGDKARYLTMQTAEGRYYPVFLLTSLPAGCGMVWVAQHGWCVAG